MKNSARLCAFAQNVNNPDRRALLLLDAREDFKEFVGGYGKLVGQAFAPVPPAAGLNAFPRCPAAAHKPDAKKLLVEAVVQPAPQVDSEDAIVVVND